MGNDLVDRERGHLETAARTADLALLELDFGRGGREALMMMGEALGARFLVVHEAEEAAGSGGSSPGEATFTPILVWASGGDSSGAVPKLGASDAAKIALGLEQSAMLETGGGPGTAVTLYLPIRMQGRLAGILSAEFQDRPSTVSGSALASFALSLSAAWTRHRYELALARARAEEENARRASALLLARAGHELKTPLVALDGISALLEEKGDTMDPARRREAIRFVRQGGRRLLRLVEEVLVLARMDAGLRKSANEPVDIHAIGAAAQSLMSGLLHGKQVSFRLTIDPALPSGMRGDRDAIDQILENLLGNAVKFTEQGTIELRMERCSTGEFPDAVAIIVRDEGPGMDAAVLASITEPFHATRPGLSGERGSGLGLTIVSSLTRIIGGRFSMESGTGTVADSGMGTEARLILPLQTG